jgi:potassium efflux system protein
VLLIGIFLSVISHQGYSQTPGVSDSIPRALSLAEIPDYGKKTRQLMREVEALLGEQNALNPILNEIDYLDSIIDVQLAVLKDSTKSYRIEFLDKKVREIDLTRIQLTEWKEKVDVWTTDALDKTASIQFGLSTCKLTIDSVETRYLSGRSMQPNNIEEGSGLNEVAAKMANDLRNFQEGLTRQQADLSEWVLRLQGTRNDLNILQEKLDEVGSQIAMRKESLNANIWIPEAPPIWKLSSTTYSDQAKMLWSELPGFSDLTEAQLFLKRNPNILYQLLFSFLMTLGLVVFLRFQTHEYFSSSSEITADVFQLLESPVLSSLVLTWFWSILFFPLPPELERITNLIMILPTVYILYKLSMKSNRWKLLAFVVIFMIFLLTPVLNFAPILQRFILMALNFLSIGVLLWIRTHRQQLIEEENKWWLGSLPTVIILFTLINFGALIANIIGSVQLAELLTNATLSSFLAFIILRGMIMLTRSFFFLLLLGPLIKHSYILQEDSDTVLKKLSEILRYVGFFVWIVIMLDELRIREEVLGWLYDLINYSLNVGELSISLWNIVAFFLILRLSAWLSTFIRYVLDKEVYPRANMNEGVSNTISQMIRYTLSLLGFLLALSAAGISLDKISIALGALGVGIGFGLQNIVSNFISGIILALERPIKIGDIVDLGGNVSGFVRDIGLRASRVHTWEGSDVIVPNAELISGRVTNWTLSNKWKRIMVDVRVPFNADLEQVSKILIDTASETEGIMKNPGPYINLEGIGESAMVFKLYAWINDANASFSRGTKLRKEVYSALKAAGYETPLPQQNVNIHSEKGVEKSPPES